MTAIQQKMDFMPYIPQKDKAAAEKAYAPARYKKPPSALPPKRHSISLAAYCAHLANHGVKMGRNQLFKWLRESGYLSKQKGTWNMPHKKYIEQGLFEVKETFVIIADEQVPKYSPQITPAGMNAIDKKLKSRTDSMAKAN